MAEDSNQVRPNYGPAPKGKAQIMRQGQTEADAFGQNPMVESNTPEPKDNPDL
jgi:hypothetical protein